MRASELRHDSDEESDESDESDAEHEYSYDTLQRSVNARANQQYPDTRPKNISKSANWVSDEESDDSTDEDLSQAISHFKDSRDNPAWYQQQSAAPVKYLGNKLSRSSTRRRRFKSDTYTPQELYDSRSYSRNFKTTRMHEMEDDESDYHSSFEAPPVHYNHSKQYRPSAENSLNSSQEDNSAPSPSVSLTKKPVVAPILGTAANPVLLPTIHELPTPKTTPKESAAPHRQRAAEDMELHHHGSLLVDSDDSDSEEFESSKLQQLVHRLHSDDDVDPRVLRHSAMLDSESESDSDSDSDSSDNTSARSFDITPSEKQLRASGSSVTRSGAKRRTIVIRTSQNIAAPQPVPQPVPELLVAPVTEQLRGLRVSSSITDSDDEHWDPYKTDLR